MISLRTLVNTTIFWLLVVSVFWGYTRWIDNTPAKELLHTIGWDNLGNLTITTDQGLSIDSEDMLIRKLDNMEKMIQATNMNCSLLQINSTNPTTTDPTQEIPTSSQNNYQIIAIPIFDTLKNNKLPKEQQATPNALSLIKRPVMIENPSVPDIFNIIKNISLTSEEQGQGYVNILRDTVISVEKSSLVNGKLTLLLSNTANLTPPEFNLISSIIEQTYKQFTGITSVIIQQS